MGHLNTFDRSFVDFSTSDSSYMYIDFDYLRNTQEHTKLIWWRILINTILYKR